LDYPVSIILAGISSTVVAVIAIVLCFIKIIPKYRERRQMATLYLCLTFFGWAGACLSATTVYFTAGFSLDVGGIFQKSIYTCIFAATIFTFLFASEIFFTIKKMWNWIYIAIGIICILIIDIFGSSEISFVQPENYPVLDLETTFGLILLAYLLPTLIGIFITARNTSKRLDESAPNRDLFKVGYNLIGWAQVFTFFVFIVDTIATSAITIPALYSLFLILTWVFALFAVFCYYEGALLPDNIKKWIEWRKSRAAVKPLAKPRANED